MTTFRKKTEPAQEAPAPRRDFLKSTAFLGGCAMLSGSIGAVFSRLAQAASRTPLLDRGEHQYHYNDPDHIIYSACLQCHTACPIKCKVVDGVLVKIDGNPFCPQSKVPNVPYASPLDKGARVEGKICPKGQSGIETLYDPHRIRKVLKRKPGTPRGAGQWITIDFNKAVEEIVEGGDLFGEGKVSGIKDVYALRDRSVSKAMAADVKKLQKKKMTVDEFKTKHADNLGVLIDPDHPDLGSKNNQFVFLAGRIEHGRKEVMKWFTHYCLGSINAFEHTTICEQSHHIAFAQATNKWKNGKWTGGTDHMKPDLASAHFVIFFGTGFSDANFGPPLLSQLTANATVDGPLKIAVVDPRLSRSAGKAHWWIPIKPGGDSAFAMGMIRWTMDNNRFDRRFLENANAAAAKADGETAWTAASYLVKIDEGRPARYLRAEEVGLGTNQQFVVQRDGELVAVDPNDKKNAAKGDLEGSLEKDGIKARTAFQLLGDRARKMSLESYAEKAGVEQSVIVKMAKAFTSYGKKAVAEFYRGPVQHTNGYYAGQALITLNVLIGNSGWKGGMAKGGGHWHESGGKPGNPYDFHDMHPAPFWWFGPKLSREKARYEESTLFNGYPAKRPWYPYTGNLYQEVIASAGDGYPYPVKVLFLHMGTPVLSSPAGHKQIAILRDPKKIPLFIASDIVVGETSMYADYIFPDTAIWERWGTPHTTPAMLVPVSKVRQPTVAPVVETVKVDGQEMPVNMESFLIAVGKKLGLPGIGKDAFGPGKHLNHQDDWYLKTVANIAMGDKKGDHVPAADSKEMEIFRRARKHLPPSVFDEKRWKKAAGPDYWPYVVYVLNRGGRFEDSTKMYKGDKQAHPYKGMFQLFIENVAKGRNSISGRHFDGLPRVEGPLLASGKPVGANPDYPFHLITYKEIFGGHSRTMPGDLWLGELMWENAVLMNRVDAKKLGLRSGDRVRLGSPSNPDGAYDLGNGEVLHVEGKVAVLEGIRPGVVGVSWHFGHWAYGGRDLVVDGKVVKGDPRRRRGLVPNPIMLEDTVIGNVCLTDPIGGSSSFYDTMVKITRVP
jgi:tetrathionate reductase subunit A